MRTNYFGEIMIAEADGLFPGWVAVRMYPHDKPIEVKEFQICIASLPGFLQQISDAAIVRVWVKRRGRDVRSYLIGKGNKHDRNRIS